MSNYRRALVPGATYFFTVTLEDRTSELLVREIEILREAYAATVRTHPFQTIAICVMPEHLHSIRREMVGNKLPTLRGLFDSERGRAGRA